MNDRRPAGTSSLPETFGSALVDTDRRLAELIAAEEHRQDETINLIASESYCPRSTVEAEASILVSKNATGYPGKRSVSGCELADEIETLACSRAQALFGGEHINLQALSSTIANIAVLRGLLQPGATILSLAEAAGGHHSHGAACHLSGQDYRVVPFGLDEAVGGVDLEALRRTARDYRPAMIVAGSTACPRAIDFAGLAAVAAEVGALFFADIAHVAGLVAAGLHVNPVDSADVVTTSTHKTLCGPRTGGVVICRNAHAEAIDRALFPGLQGAPGAHIIAGRATLFEWVGTPAFRRMMEGVKDNAGRFAEALLAEGLRLYLGGTDTHMVVIDLRGSPLRAPAAAQRLARYGLLTNAVELPHAAPGGEGGGIRLGSTAMTMRGMGPAEFVSVARKIGEILRAGEGGAEAPAGTANRVRELAFGFPVPPALARQSDRLQGGPLG